MKRTNPAWVTFTWVLSSLIMTSTIAGCISVPQTNVTNRDPCISYSWSDEKGNWVQALKGTIGAKRPNAHKVAIKVIKNQFFGIGGAGFSWKGDKEYVRNNLSASEQESFFKAIQNALSDTGKAKYRLNYPGTLTQCIGLPYDDDAILELRGC